MTELFSAEISNKILNVVGDFWEHFGEVLPKYGHSYLNRYCERLAGIERMTHQDRDEFLGESVELLEAISGDHPFKDGVLHLAIKALIKDCQAEIPRLTVD
jgi:hypothetical protein